MLPAVTDATSQEPPGDRCRILELDDACLSNIFRNLLPLPDLFNASQTCWRVNRLTNDKRLWLVVSPNVRAEPFIPSTIGCCVVPSLDAAVAVSRYDGTSPPAAAVLRSYI